MLVQGLPYYETAPSDPSHPSRAQIDQLFESFLARASPVSLPGEPTLDELSAEIENSPKRKPVSEDFPFEKKLKCDGERQERRRVQNRLAAAASRTKKKQHYQDLEAKVQYLTDCNRKLHTQVASLSAENLQLKRHSPLPSHATTSSSPSSSLSQLVTLESAELAQPQQSEVTKLGGMTEMASMWILGILCSLMASAHMTVPLSPPSVPSPPDREMYEGIVDLYLFKCASVNKQQGMRSGQTIKSSSLEDGPPV